MQKMGHLILPKTGHLSVPLTVVSVAQPILRFYVTLFCCSAVTIRIVGEDHCCTE